MRQQIGGQVVYSETVVPNLVQSVEHVVEDANIIVEGRPIVQRGDEHLHVDWHARLGHRVYLQQDVVALVDDLLPASILPVYVQLLVVDQLQASLHGTVGVLLRLKG